MHLRLSPGTQVVVADRGTAVVRELLETSTGPLYVIAFADGSTGTFERQQLNIRKQAQTSALGPPT